MADPRFFDNRGPFALAELCRRAALECPRAADADELIFDVAGLSQAGPSHLSFFEGGRLRPQFQTTKAGWCLVRAMPDFKPLPEKTVLVPASAVARAFGVIASAFYPEHELEISVEAPGVHPTSRLGEGVVLGAGVVIGPHAEIGDATRIASHTIIGRGVTIGRNCRIGSGVSIQCAHLGDEVIVQPGAVIGASGFGFASASDGHAKLPQLGRVIIQDRVEIGANSTVDRGASADTVIGEGCKIDNLVQIGHNTRIGRHCVLAGQVGISGSVVLGDFVILGGKVGIADHVTIGDRARVAALSGVGTDLEGGRDYGGIPARPMMRWKRETAALIALAKRGSRARDE